MCSILVSTRLTVYSKASKLEDWIGTFISKILYSALNMSHITSRFGFVLKEEIVSLLTTGIVG